jgi:hypothetical protein
MGVAGSTARVVELLRDGNVVRRDRSGGWSNYAFEWLGVAAVMLPGGSAGDVDLRRSR